MSFLRTLRYNGTWMDGLIAAGHSKAFFVDNTDFDARQALRELRQITVAEKPALIGEIGTLPSAEALAEKQSGWISYMTWCREFCLTEDYTTAETLRAVYHHSWGVTKDRLPVLY